jgi:hypothetical protein
LGSLVEGVPVTIGGVPILRGLALLDKIASSADVEPFLAGGWFHQEPVTRFCPFKRFDPAVDWCYSFALYESASAGEPVWISRGVTGTRPLGPFLLPEEAYRPVVLEVHTNDPRCTADDTGCDGRPVLDEIVWLGPVQAP